MMKRNLLPYHESSVRTRYRRRQDGTREAVESDASDIESHNPSGLLVAGVNNVEHVGEANVVDNVENVVDYVDGKVANNVENGINNVVNILDNVENVVHVNEINVFDNVVDDDDDDDFHDAPSHISEGSGDEGPLDFDTSDTESISSVEHEEIIDEDSNIEGDRSSLWKDLVVWSIFHRIGHNALCALLSILKLCNPGEVKSLPKDARSLKHTPQDIKPDHLEGGGEYYHLGLLKELLKALNLSWVKFQKIEVFFGIDGIPLFKSKQMEFYPILCKILSVPGLEHHVFPIGLYCGKEKPQNLGKYLEKFIKELIVLIKDGVIFNGKKYEFIVKGFSCDCPAKSMVLCIISSNGYGSCTKCHVWGEWSYLCQRVYFQEVNSSLRTNEEFLSHTDLNFHQGNTPLTQIPTFDFVNWFPLDYLHVLCLGVVRTLLRLWVTSTKNRCKLSANRISQASGRMLLFQRFVPSDFARDTRAFEEYKRWKGTELRLFICYLAPFVMDGILTEVRQTNFLLLYVAVRFLLNPVQCREFKETARALLIQFVETCKTAYHANILTHNFHNLIHLPDNLNTFNNLEECSAFDFEGFLHILKKSLKKGGCPLQQAIKRWIERTSVNANAPKKPVKDPFCTVGNRGGPLLEGCCNPQYKNVQFPSFKVSLSARNCCFTTIDSSIVVARNICFLAPSDSMVIVGQKFLSKESAFTFPCDSANLDIFYVSELSDLITVPLNEVWYKNMILPCKEGFVVQPLLHTLS